MIKSNLIFEKKHLNIKKEEHLMLLELEGIKNNKNIKKKKKKLNLSLVIDISGSMDLPVHNHRNYNPFYIQNINNFNYKEKSESRLSMAKKAAINVINSLNEGDFISLVSFHDSVEVVQESIKINNENKNIIIDKINNLYTKGCTNLHGGWLEGCKEVSKNFKDNSLNRVLLLTDGETNSGITNTDQIVSDVLNVYKKSVSVSTFGIGEGFNENLLQSMSSSGGGNFYFIENENDFSEMFKQEFQGLSNISAYDIQCEFNLNKDIYIIENLNDFVLSENKYLIPSISNNKKVSLLFKLSTKKLDKKIKNLGHITIKYKNSEGKVIKKEDKINIKVVNEKDWEKLELNKELKVQEVLLSVAKNKILATEALNIGDVNKAQNILRSSSNLVGSCSIFDIRLQEENNSLEETILSSNSKNIDLLKKDISYQSYKTRNNR